MRLTEHNLTKSTGIGFTAALLAAALFGSVSTIAKPVLATVDPFLLSSLVYIISAMFFSAIIALGNKTASSSQTVSSSSKRSHSYYLVLIIITTSIIGATIAPAMFFFGLGQTTASDTSLLSNGETVFSIIFAILFFNEKLKPLGYIAALMVLAGLVVVTTNFQFHSSLLKMNSGNLLVLGATVLWGLDNNICRIITYHMKIARLVQLKSVIGGGILLIFAVVFLHTPLHLEVVQLLQIILLGVVGFGTSLYFFLSSMKRIGIVKSVLVLSFSSVFGLIFASLLLGERIAVHQIIAIVVMIAGVFLINIENKKKRTNNNTITSIGEKTDFKDG